MGKDNKNRGREKGIKKTPIPVHIGSKDWMPEGYEQVPKKPYTPMIFEERPPWETPEGYPLWHINRLHKDLTDVGLFYDYETIYYRTETDEGYEELLREIKQKRAKSKDTDIKNDDLSAYELDYNNPPEQAPTAYTIDGEIVGTLGNFSAIIGKAKAKKTFFLTSTIAALISWNEVLKVKGALTDDKKIVLVFDTEQSNYHAHKTFERIDRQGGRENLRFFTLREHPTAERLAIIQNAIETTEGLGVVVIDGIRDLIRDINSPDEATMINDKLLEWTGKFNIHIIVVLHQNKTDSNARGHIGTELINKAETTISIEKDKQSKEISTVKVEYSRNKEFEPFSFQINDIGLPELIDGNGSNEIKPSDYAPKIHATAIEYIFKDADTLKTMELRGKIAQFSNKYYHKFGDTIAKKFLNHFLEKEYLNIQQAGNAKLYSLNYHMLECYK